MIATADRFFASTDANLYLLYQGPKRAVARDRVQPADLGQRLRVGGTDAVTLRSADAWAGSD